MVQAQSAFEYSGHESDEVSVSEFRAIAPSYGMLPEYAALVKKPHGSQATPFSKR